MDRHSKSQGVGSKSFMPLMWEGTPTRGMYLGRAGGQNYKDIDAAAIEGGSTIT